MNVNVRPGKYEGTTRVSEREKREKGLIFKREISKKRRERYPPQTATETAKNIKISFAFSSKPDREDTFFAFDDDGDDDEQLLLRRRSTPSNKNSEPPPPTGTQQQEY